MDNDTIRDVYIRFMEMRNTHPGIYLYPRYTEDLNILLEYIGLQLIREERLGAVNVVPFE